MTVRKVENLLSGILSDLDTILDAWENNPRGDRDYRNPATSKTAQNALRMDAEWLRAALGNKDSPFLCLQTKMSSYSITLYNLYNNVFVSFIF